MLILMEFDKEQRRVAVGSLPRAGEYITQWADSGATARDIYEVVAVVHFASADDLNPLLPSALCEQRAVDIEDPIAWVRNHTIKEGGA